MTSVAPPYHTGRGRGHPICTVTVGDAFSPRLLHELLAESSTRSSDVRSTKNRQRHNIVRLQNTVVYYYLLLLLLPHRRRFIIKLLLL